jgi:hypothetical protein
MDAPQRAQLEAAITPFACVPSVLTPPFMRTKCRRWIRERVGDARSGDAAKLMYHSAVM